MTLLSLFNKTLKEIPEKAEYLEKLIFVKNYSDEKTNQMLAIIRQLQKRDLQIGYFDNCIFFNFLTLTLSPIECGIEDSEFDSQNALKAQNYICDLLTDINNLSTDIKFRFAGFKNYNKKATFSIAWEL